MCYTWAMEKVVIVGGGAGGLFCAARLLQAGVTPVVLEAGARVGKKILVSGNGRCNLSNKNVSAERYNAPAFVAPLLRKYGLERVLGAWEELGLLCRQDAEGRIYPYSNSSGSVLNVLLHALKGAKVQTGAPVLAIKREKGAFLLTYAGGELRAENVVLACGSAAGGGRASFALARELGLETTPLRPAVTYLKTDKFKGLKGVRAKVAASLDTGGKTYEDRGEILFREDGVSGVLAFWLSSFAARASGSGVLRIDFAPDFSREKLQEVYGGREELLCGLLHKALADKLLRRGGLAAVKDFSCRVSVADTDNQVTCGGVALDELDAETMMSKKHDGLYCIGEMADIDGECGGYNLHWAWVSAMAAADGIAARIKR